MDPPISIAVATFTADQLQTFIEQAVERTLRSYRPNCSLMSASEAARFCRVRKTSLLAALKAGEIQGTYSPKGRGGRGRWRILPADVHAWIERREQMAARDPYAVLASSCAHVPVLASELRLPPS